MSMDFISILFPLFFILIIILQFTGIGRNWSRKFHVGEVIEDLGLISDEEFYGDQQIRLLKCRKNEETFYVLEIQQGRFGAANVQWIKLGQGSVQKLLSKLR